MKSIKSRSFKAIYTDTNGEVVMRGRYCGTNSKQVACKAFTGICKLFIKEGKKIDSEIKFGMKEVTKNSRGKIYFFSGKRVELDQPITLEIIGGKQISYKYNNIVIRANSIDCTHLLTYKDVNNEEIKTETLVDDLYNNIYNEEKFGKHYKLYDVKLKQNDQLTFENNYCPECMKNNCNVKTGCGCEYCDGCYLGMVIDRLDCLKCKYPVGKEIEVKYLL